MFRAILTAKIYFVKLYVITYLLMEIVTLSDTIRDKRVTNSIDVKTRRLNSDENSISEERDEFFTLRISFK